MSIVEERTISEITRRAAAVGANHVRMQDADRHERDEEGRALGVAIEAARPGLEALSSRIQIAHTPGGGATWYAMRGLYVGAIDEPAGPMIHGGEVEGEDLFLLTDGCLLEVDYVGVGDGAWSTHCRILSPRACVNEWQLTTIVVLVNRALAAHLTGSTVRRTDKMREMADRFGKAAKILQG